jgi:hypothetical protein
LFIPVENENVLCLANIIALYRGPEETNILERDGTITKTSFTPITLKRRQTELWQKSAIKGRSLL